MRIPRKVTRLLDYYYGEAKTNGSEAARLAGYKHPNKDAYRITHKLVDYMKIREQEYIDKSIMSGTEIDMTLSAIARDTGHRDQVKSLELLAKMQGKLSDKVTIDTQKLMKDLDRAIDKLMQSKVIDPKSIDTHKLDS